MTCPCELPIQESPLTKLSPPVLFINGELDPNCQPGDLHEFGQHMSAADIRSCIIPVRGNAEPDSVGKRTYYA